MTRAGTGKTSMINMVNELISGDVASIMFNTWQYSQFNLGDALPILMLNKLASKLSDNGITMESAKQTLAKLGKMAIHIAAGRLTGGGDTNDDIFNFSEVESIVSIKNEFQKAITEKAKNKTCKRVVIFVDDLDRLEPEKAVELLEVLKLFLDCENCVFVLAVDYSVVTQGVRAKYGQDMDSEKGKSFFDKIIQLPFKMPVAKYNIDGYLKELMKNVWNTGADISDEDVKGYLSIIENTIGKNPRSIKRVVNSFIIVEKVAKEQKAYNNPTIIQHVQKLLFLLLCVQLAWEKLYNHIIERANEVTDKGVKAYAADMMDTANFDNMIEEIYGKEEKPLGNGVKDDMRDTISIYCDWINQLAASVTNGEEEVLKVLQYSAITSNDDKVVVKRQAQEISLDKFSEAYGNNDLFQVMKERLKRSETEGFVLKAFSRKNDNCLRLLNENEARILECVPKKAGWEISFFMDSEQDKKKMMDAISENLSDRISKVYEYSSNKKAFYVTGIKEVQLFNDLMDLLMKHC